MSSVLCFIACERVIVDSTTQLATLSTIMTELTVPLPAALIPPPKGSAAPTAWTVFTMWHRLESERRAFDMKFEFLAPDNELLFDGAPIRIDFEGFTKRVQNVISPIVGFPIWIAGDLQLVLKVRDDGGTAFREEARYPIRVIHKAQD